MSSVLVIKPYEESTWQWGGPDMGARTKSEDFSWWQLSDPVLGRPGVSVPGNHWLLLCTEGTLLSCVANVFLLEEEFGLKLVQVCSLWHAVNTWFYYFIGNCVPWCALGVINHHLPLLPLCRGPDLNFGLRTSIDHHFLLITLFLTILNSVSQLHAGRDMGPETIGALLCSQPSTSFQLVWNKPQAASSLPCSVSPS